MIGVGTFASAVSRTKPHGGSNQGGRWGLAEWLAPATDTEADGDWL